MIGQDPAVKVDMPKIHEKTITRLDIDEVANLLDEVESGESLTEKQQKFHEKTKTRDLAMMTLLLGTGIRVSECVVLIWMMLILKIMESKFTVKEAQKLLFTLVKK